MGYIASWTSWLLASILLLHISHQGQVHAGVKVEPQSIKTDVLVRVARQATINEKFPIYPRDNFTNLVCKAGRKPYQFMNDTVAKIKCGKNAIVDAHNFYRRLAGASNMEYMVVWATSREIGCGFASCKSKYIICNYGPPGNLVGAKPFKIGRACTECPFTSRWCKEGLCRRDCKEPKCACVWRCKNCGELNKSSCTCKCKDGWTGHDCTTECKDSSSGCGKPNTNLRRQYCNDPLHRNETRRRCPATCGLCVHLDNPKRCG